MHLPAFLMRRVQTAFCVCSARDLFIRRELSLNKLMFSPLRRLTANEVTWLARTVDWNWKLLLGWMKYQNKLSCVITAHVDELRVVKCCGVDATTHSMTMMTIQSLEESLLGEKLGQGSINALYEWCFWFIWVWISIVVFALTFTFTSKS